MIKALLLSVTIALASFNAGRPVVVVVESKAAIARVSA